MSRLEWESGSPVFSTYYAWGRAATLSMRAGWWAEEKPVLLAMLAWNGASTTWSWCGSREMSDNDGLPPGIRLRDVGGETLHLHSHTFQSRAVIAWDRGGER